MHIPSTVIYFKIIQLKTPNILPPATGELGAISKLSYLGEAKLGREDARVSGETGLCFRVSSRVPSLSSLLFTISPKWRACSQARRYSPSRVSRAPRSHWASGRLKKAGKKSPFLRAFTYTCISCNVYSHL